MSEVALDDPEAVEDEEEGPTPWTSAGEPMPSDVPDFTEHVRRPPNLAVALLSHAESLEDDADELENQIARLEEQVVILTTQVTSMRARAYRYKELSETAEQEGHFGQPVTGDKMVSQDSATKYIREALTADGVTTMDEVELADMLGTTKAKLRERSEILQREGKLGRMRSQGRTVYAWIAMDVEEGNTPTNARTLGPVGVEGMGSEAVQRGVTQRKSRSGRGVRKAQSTPGQGHRMRQQDKRYEEAKAKAEERKEQQRKREAASALSSRQAARVASRKKKAEESQAKQDRRKENQAKSERDKIRAKSSPRPDSPRKGDGKK